MRKTNKVKETREAYEDNRKMTKEEKIREKRKEILQYLKDEQITASDWKDRIVKYINQRYEECTLQ